MKDVRLLFDVPISEHRYFPRWEVHNKVYLRDEASRVVEATTKDLTATGACVCAHADIPLHHRLKMKVYVSENNNFETEGTVIWKKTDRDSHYCYAGISFDQLPEKTSALLLEYSFLMK